jgi:hypothetical protein
MVGTYMILRNLVSEAYPIAALHIAGRCCSC